MVPASSSTPIRITRRDSSHRRRRPPQLRPRLSRVCMRLTTLAIGPSTPDAEEPWIAFPKVSPCRVLFIFLHWNLYIFLFFSCIASFLPRCPASGKASGNLQPTVPPPIRTDLPPPPSSLLVETRFPLRQACAVPCARTGVDPIIGRRKAEPPAFMRTRPPYHVFMSKSRAHVDAVVTVAAAILCAVPGRGELYR